jgi:inhibitor of KinA sporulation pathway (predicted exonuclease)
MDIYIPENKNEIVQSLYYSKCELKKCLGFCKYHQAYVTVNQLKQKECLAKECPHLVKTEHEFWVERDEKLKRKKEKKNLKKIIEQQDEQKKIKKKKYVCIEITTKEKNGLRKGALRGLKSEIVKIEAVKLDEKYNFESEFSAFIKPVDEKIEKKFEQKTGITQEKLSSAKIFLPVMNDFYKWIEGDDVCLFCWTSFPYIQFNDETYVKARDNFKLFDLYKTFVDLQFSLSNVLKTDEKISLEDALKIMSIKTSKKTGITNACKIGKILQKMSKQIDFDMKKVENYEKGTVVTKDQKSQELYLTDMSAYIKPELLEKYSNTLEKRKKKRGSCFSKLFMFSKYRIPFFFYREFRKKMKNI